MMTAPRATGPSRLDGILFAEDFGDDELLEGETQPGHRGAAETPTARDNVEIEPHYSADHLASARRDGFDAGRAAGQDDAQAQHQRRIARACEQITHFLECDATSSQKLLEQSIQAVAQLLMGTLAAMLPSIGTRHAAHEIAGMVANLMGSMTADSVISASVATSLLDDLRAALVVLPVHLARRVVLVPVDTMPVGDATLEWAQGSASHSPGRARQAVLEILTQLELIEPEQPPKPQKPRAEWPGAVPAPATMIEKGETIDA